jgi:hypothetical protein
MDYWTKHHCAAHHIEKHPEILTPKIVLETLSASVKRTPNLQQLALPSIKPSQYAPAAAATYILQQHYKRYWKGVLDIPNVYKYASSY